jgi:hypothetical protein
VEHIVAVGNLKGGIDRDDLCIWMILTALLIEHRGLVELPQGFAFLNARHRRDHILDAFIRSDDQRGGNFWVCTADVGIFGDIDFLRRWWVARILNFAHNRATIAHRHRLIAEALQGEHHDSQQ